MSVSAELDTIQEEQHVIKAEPVQQDFTNLADYPYAQFMANNLPLTTNISAHSSTTNSIPAMQTMPANILSAPPALRRLLPNPTLPPNIAATPPSALAALQQSLQTRLKPNDTSPGFPQTMGMPPRNAQLYVPPKAPQTRKDEMLNENWSTKIAYAATLSSIINETSKIIREKVEMELKPNWAGLLYHVSAGEDQQASRQRVYDEAIEHIFNRAERTLQEITSSMSRTKIAESIGMLKGLTDGVCNLIQNSAIHLPGCTASRMRHLFENKLLIIWCSLLLRATTDVREAMQRYLTHQAFQPYFYFKSALNHEFYKHLTSDERALVRLRSHKEQSDFEANTKKYVEEANLSLMAVRKITVLPQQDRENAVSVGKGRKRRNADGDDGYDGDGGYRERKPPKKRRKKSRYQLFRQDGTPRRRQQNPCDRRICKRMWQSDGVTRGCRQNSHPRGVCPCWKKLEFTKEDEKNGGILKWLENRYGKKYTL